MKKIIIFVTLTGLLLGCTSIIYIKTRQLLFPERYRSVVYKIAAQYDLDPLLVAAVISAESSFKANALSVSDARGLMQIMPSTSVDIAEDLGFSSFEISQLYEADINIEFGCYYLRKLYQIYQDTTLSLIAYNAGISNLNKWLHNHHSAQELLESGIVFQESKRYVKKITRNYKILCLLDKIESFAKYDRQQNN
ncbi:MAG: lytic transglycosylase domain-containing protein [Chlamydiota bacterium]|nr:lytic transglycosylase domain-containing protein [Chlamydiota bacterium]